MEDLKKSLPRNVILDLLPSYIAGELSKESQYIVEQYAKNDPDIAELIRDGNLENEVFSAEMPVQEDLGIKTIRRIRKRIRRQMLYVVLLTMCLLLVPFVAMFFTDEVTWNWFDFTVAGILLFGAGFAFVLVSNISKRIVYRMATGIVVLSALVLIWVTLAVGIIGSESNKMNFLYFVVPAIIVAGATYWRFQPKGMAYTMFATAIFQFLIPFIAMLFDKSSMEEPPGMIQIVFFNTIFALAFALSGILFRKAD